MRSPSLFPAFPRVRWLRALAPALWLCLAVSLSSCGFVSSLWPFGSKDAPQAAEPGGDGGPQAASPALAKVRPAPEQEAPLAPRHKNPFAQRAQAAAEAPGPQAAAQATETPEPQAAAQAKPQAEPQAEARVEPRAGTAAPQAPEPSQPAQAAPSPREQARQAREQAKEQAKQASEAQAAQKGAPAQAQPAWKAEQFKDATGTAPAAAGKSMEAGPVALVIKRGGPDCHRLSLNVLLPSRMSSGVTDSQSYSVSMSVDDAQEINLVAKVDAFGNGLVTLKLLPRGNDAALLLSQMQDGKVVRLTTIFEAKALQRHFSLEGFMDAMRASADLCGQGGGKKQ